MSIKSAITDTGYPVKVIPFSPEVLIDCFKDNQFQDIRLVRLGSFYDSSGYIETDKEFKKLVDEVKCSAPEPKKAINKIHDVVSRKELQFYEEGYKAGMLDLMTALIFNDAQITHTQLVGDNEV